ncbi:MAG: hypothetical protein CM15mP98_04750 [Paracoccaceae bacterium]|nr:MAG: hypothetical protein CM15mP98_04750 [Paracoccaceae bacterium]
MEIHTLKGCFKSKYYERFESAILHNLDNGVTKTKFFYIPTTHSDHLKIGKECGVDVGVFKN